MTHNTDKPSGRIRHALECLIEWENIPTCQVRMNLFHDYDKGMCRACFGGAAVAVGQYSPNEWPGLGRLDLPLKWARYEESLDAFRWGHVDKGFTYMALPSQEGGNFNRHINGYHQDRNSFLADMYVLAEDLERGGW